LWCVPRAWAANAMRNSKDMLWSPQLPDVSTA
jgi:hypothetical protein